MRHCVLVAVLLTATAASALAQDRSRSVYSRDVGSVGVNITAVKREGPAFVDLQIVDGIEELSVHLSPKDARQFAHDADSLLALSVRPHGGETLTYRADWSIPRFSVVVSDAAMSAYLAMDRGVEHVIAAADAKKMREVIAAIRQAAEFADSMDASPSTQP